MYMSERGSCAAVRILKGIQMKPVACLLALLSTTAAYLPAAEGGVPPTKVEEAPTTDLLGNALETITKEEAEALVAQGQKAMAESTDNPRRSVDAAVAFSKSLKYYEQAGDADKLSDIYANIFWCKKRMNLDDIKAFLALKKDDKYVEAALAKADTVVKKEVTADQAGEYFIRAERFASRNPDKFDQISVRYFEVAERFVGTEIGIKAHKLSLAAQQSHMKQMKDTELAARQTLFSKPTKIADGIKQAAVPSPEDQKVALSSIRSLYKADYAKKKPSQKASLLDKLVEQCKSTKDDPVMLYGLLQSSMDLAMECMDYPTVIDVCDRMAVAFAGVDAKELKKKALGKSKNPNVMAILKLLDNPEDGEANSIAGKYFCYDAGQWEISLPLLMHGSDVALKALAEMENLSPEGVAQQVELADKWYDLGKKANGITKIGPWSRALSWYQKAEKKITGISKDRVVKRMDEIDSALPMTNLDYDNLTTKQWERLKSGIVEVSATKDRNDINLRLAAGKRYRIVPHPTDTWSPPNYYGTAGRTVDYKGNHGKGTDTTYYSSGDYKEGALVMQIETGKWKKPGIIEGEGRVFMGPYSSNGYAGGGTGVIRVKIIPAEDD
jgi:tetratricopeptide (TPR) repeat protein